MINTPPKDIEAQHNNNLIQKTVQPPDTPIPLIFQPGDIVRSNTTPFEDRLLLVLDSTHSSTYLQAISGNKIPNLYKSTQDLRHSSRDSKNTGQLIYSAEIYSSDSNSSTSSDPNTQQKSGNLTEVNVPKYTRTQHSTPNKLTFDQWKP